MKRVLLLFKSIPRRIQTNSLQPSTTPLQLPSIISMRSSSSSSSTTLSSSSIVSSSLMHSSPREISKSFFSTLIEYTNTRTALLQEFKNSVDIHEANGRFDLKKQVESFKNELEDMNELLLVCEDGDDVVKSEIFNAMEILQERFNQHKIASVLAQPGNQGSDCFVDISAGAGGTDAFDWVRMLVDMYSQWKGDSSDADTDYNCHVISLGKNTESDAGYRHATLRIVGPNCLGWMRAEAGVHRLVRISPFDPNHKRHTSFAQVIVYPNLETQSGKANGNTQSVIIHESDLRIDTYRSSGAGGQSVNKTDSAVRLTHIPTGIVVTCQNQRSQHQNKAFAMNVLKSRLAALEVEKLIQRKRDSMTGQGDNSWGNQIKSLVLNPYRVVKDHRTKWESGNVDSYLSGGKVLTASMRSYLEHQYASTQSI